MSGLVRDLADAVFAHDREVSSLKMQVEKIQIQSLSAGHVLTPASSPPASGESASNEAVPSVKIQKPSYPPISLSPPVIAATSTLAMPVFVPPGQSAFIPVPEMPTAVVPKVQAFVFPDPFPAPETASIPLPKERVVSSTPDPKRDSKAEAIRIALNKQAFELHLQPIVTLPQRRVSGYEALVRITADGEMLEPAEFSPFLERTNSSMAFDTAALLKTAGIVRHLAAKGSEAFVALSISGASLSSPDFLTQAAHLLETYPELRHRLIIEAPQSAWEEMKAAGTVALRRLRDFGLGLAMDRVTHLRLEPWSLADIGLSSIRIPASLLLEPSQSQPGSIPPATLPTALERAGIRMIATGIESEKQVIELIDTDTLLAQGALFSPPRPVRAEVYDLMPDPTRLAQAKSIPESEARSLRSVLRQVG
jgi:cyclic-di-GMP phosphodiesterase, flagellum assembly factor TipF